MAYWCFIPRLNPFCKFLMCIFYTSSSTFIWKKVNVFKPIMMKRYTNFPLFRPMLQSYGNQSNGLCSTFIGWSQWHITESKPVRVRFQDFLAKALTWNEKKLVLLLYDISYYWYIFFYIKHLHSNIKPTLARHT